MSRPHPLQDVGGRRAVRVRVGHVTLRQPRAVNLRRHPSQCLPIEPEPVQASVRVKVRREAVAGRTNAKPRSSLIIRNRQPAVGQGMRSCDRSREADAIQHLRVPDRSGPPPSQHRGRRDSEDYCTDYNGSENWYKNCNYNFPEGTGVTYRLGQADDGEVVDSTCWHYVEV